MIKLTNITKNRCHIYPRLLLQLALKIRKKTFCFKNNNVFGNSFKEGEDSKGRTYECLKSQQEKVIKNGGLLDHRYEF